MNKINTAMIAVLFLLAPLAAGTIRVDSPNGGESLILGDTYGIAWTATGITQDVKIILVNESGSVFGTIVTDRGNGESPYPWTVGRTGSGDAPAGRYKVRVATMDGGTKDISDALFTIAAAGSPDPDPTPTPTLTITSPRAGDRYHVGSRQTVTWTSSGLSGNARIYLKRDSANASQIAGLQEVDVAAGSAPWEPELLAPLVGDEVADYHIHVVCGGVHAVSAAFAIDRREMHEFTISNPVMIQRLGRNHFQVTVTDSESDFKGPLYISYWCHKMGLGNAVRDYYMVDLRRNVAATVDLEELPASYWENECDVNFVFEVNAGRIQLERDYGNNKTQKKFCWHIRDGRFVQLRLGKNYTETCERCSVTVQPADVESFSSETVRVRLEISLRNCGSTAIRDATIDVTQSWSYGGDRGSRSVDHIHGIDIEPGNYALLYRTVTLERHLNNTLAIDFDSGDGGILQGNNKFSCKPNFVGF